VQTDALGEAAVRNVSGYLTDDGRFFQDKKEAEAHERLLGVNKLIEQFVQMKWSKGDNIAESLQAWERYKAEMNK
jgi:hypothetical protein